MVSPLEVKKATKGSVHPEGEIHPTCFERALVRYPCAVMFGTLVTCFLLIGILVAVGFPKFAGGGFNARTTVTQERVDSLKLLEVVSQNIQSKHCSESPVDGQYLCRSCRTECLGTGCTNLVTNGWNSHTVNSNCALCGYTHACYPGAADWPDHERRRLKSEDSASKQHQRLLAAAVVDSLERSLSLSLLPAKNVNDGINGRLEGQFTPSRFELTHQHQHHSIQDRLLQGGSANSDPNTRCNPNSGSVSDQQVLTYEAKSGNLLTPDNLKRMCTFERFNLPTIDQFTQWCQKEDLCVTDCIDDSYETGYQRLFVSPVSSSATAVRAVCVNPNFAHAGQCKSVFNPDGNNGGPLSIIHPSLGLFADTCELLPGWQDVLRGLANFQISGISKDAINFAFDKQFIASNGTTSQFMRSKLVFVGDGSLEDWVSDTLHPGMTKFGVTETCNGIRAFGCTQPEVSVYFSNKNTMQNQMNQDMLLAGFSIVAVFLYMWFNTQSLFLACCGMFEIIMSFPLAFFAWRVLCGQKFFGFLMTMCLFIILGIGADDIFVLQDAWRQSYAQPLAIRKDKTTRFAWAYRRASNAMTVTSFTTLMAFAAAAATPVPAVKAFGIFASFVVLFDFLLVITWFAAALMVHDTYFNNPARPSSCGRPRPISEYCCGIYPAPCCAQAPPSDVDAAVQASGGSGGGSGGGADGDSRELNVDALGSAERRFYRVSPKLQEWRRPILAGFLVLFIVTATMSAVMLKPAHKLDAFFPDDHPMTRLQYISENGFLQSSSDEKFAVKVLWGLKSSPLDRSGTQELDEKNLGTLQWDTTWSTDARQKQMQLEMVEVCDKAPQFDVVASHPHPKSGQPVYETYCFMNSLKEWCAEYGFEFPRPNGPTLVHDLLSFQTDSSSQCYKDPNGQVKTGNLTFGCWMQKKMANWEGGGNFKARYDYWLSRGGFLLSSDHSHVKLASLAMNSTLQYTRNPPTDILQVDFDRWNALMEASQVDGWFVHGMFSWLTTVNALNQTAFVGVITSLCLAFLVLILSTSNVGVTCMAMSSIVCIMITVFGMMAMAGWKISILESICMIVVVGMAVDYTVHLMHSYNETSSPKRFEKAQVALTEMGVSVVSGAFTTFVAATPLLLAQFIFFQRFGSFIAMITFASILWAVVYLMTLAMTVGPELKPGTNNLVGDVDFIKYTLRCKKDDGRGATREQEMVVNRKFSVDVEAPMPVTATETTSSPLNKNKDGKVKVEQNRVI